jgi:hypothetical protein
MIEVNTSLNRAGTVLFNCINNLFHFQFVWGHFEGTESFNSTDDLITGTM